MLSSLQRLMSSPVALQVKLRSSDNDTFEVPKDVATQSVTVKELLEDTDAGAMIPLPNVTSKSELLPAGVHGCLKLCRG